MVKETFTRAAEVVEGNEGEGKMEIGTKSKTSGGRRAGNKGRATHVFGISKAVKLMILLSCRTCTLL